MSESVGSLEYAPRRTWVRRRWRRAVLLALLTSMVVAAWWWRSTIRSTLATAEFLGAQRRCMAFEPPDGQVAYEEDPVKAQVLLARKGGDYLPATLPMGGGVGAVWWPRAVRDFPEAAKYADPSTNPALLFLHERTTPAGRRVLVCVSGWPVTQAPGQLRVWACAREPATWQHPMIHAGARRTGMYDIGHYWPGRPVRIYAGRPHPSDPSRFTVEYEINGRRGVYEGKVVDQPGELNVDVQFEMKPGGPQR